MEHQVTDAARSILETKPEFKNKLENCLSSIASAKRCTIDKGTDGGLVIRISGLADILVPKTTLDDATVMDSLIERIRAQLPPRNNHSPDTNWSQFWMWLVSIGLGVAAILFGWLIGKGGVQPAIADPAFTRGLITLTLLFAGVGLVAITVIWLLFGAGGDNLTNRIDLIRNLQAPLFGILGTVVGFFFGTVSDRPASQEAAAIQARGGLIRGDTAFFEGQDLGDKQLELLSRVPGIRRLLIDRTSVTEGGLTAWVPTMADLNFLSVTASPGITQKGLDNVTEAFKKNGKTLTVVFNPEQSSKK
jgi:hypothetical protein